MAKVPFSKLKCKINEEVKRVKLNDEITIEVKQYLPVQQKLALISRVVEYAHMQDANYSNPVKVNVIRDVEIVKAYTNIAFTEKQQEDIPKTYDILQSTGILECIIEAIPQKEYMELKAGIQESIQAIYQYINSMVGMLDTISSGSSDTLLHLEQVQSGLESLQNSEVLKSITPLLGLE